MEFMWNSESTFGINVILVPNRTACGKKARKGGQISSAANSLTRRADVIATNVFHHNSFKSQLDAGSKGDLVNVRSTSGRSQGCACFTKWGESI